MTNEEFLKDVCPNHTDKSRWNKSELLSILELHKEQLRLHIVSYRRELLKGFMKHIEKDGAISFRDYDWTIRLFEEDNKTLL